MRPRSASGACAWMPATISDSASPPAMPTVASSASAAPAVPTRPSDASAMPATPVARRMLRLWWRRVSASASRHAAGDQRQRQRAEEGAALQFGCAEACARQFGQQHRHRPHRQIAGGGCQHQLAQQRPKPLRPAPRAPRRRARRARGRWRARRTASSAAEASTKSVAALRNTPGQPAARRSSAMARGPQAEAHHHQQVEEHRGGLDFPACHLAERGHARRRDERPAHAGCQQRRQQQRR